MMLICSSRCGGSLFRALFAEVEIDAAGEYQDYRLSQPGYVCLNCGAPAVDLGEVAAAMEAEAREDEASTTAAPSDTRTSRTGGSAASRRWTAEMAASATCS